jgi:hypothetical protein
VAYAIVKAIVETWIRVSAIRHGPRPRMFAIQMDTASIFLLNENQ